MRKTFQVDTVYTAQRPSTVLELQDPSNVPFPEEEVEGMIGNPEDKKVSELMAK
jgi:hypothetical protein